MGVQAGRPGRWARLAGGPGAVCEACSQSRAKVEVRVDTHTALLSQTAVTTRTVKLSKMALKFFDLPSKCVVGRLVKIHRFDRFS